MVEMNTGKQRILNGWNGGMMNGKNDVFPEWPTERIIYLRNNVILQQEPNEAGEEREGLEALSFYGVACLVIGFPKAGLLVVAVFSFQFNIAVGMVLAVGAMF